MDHSTIRHSHQSEILIPDWYVILPIIQVPVFFDLSAPTFDRSDVSFTP